MATAYDVMWQIWETERIYVEIDTNDTNLPKYLATTKYPKNRKVTDWLNSRLAAYDHSIITIRRGIKFKASNQSTIESVRNSYSKAAVELIESKFELVSINKSFNKILQKSKTKTKENKAIKAANTQISSTNLITKELLEEYDKLDKHVDYFCKNLSKILMKLCSEHKICEDICNSITIKLKSDLLLSKVELILNDIRSKRQSLKR